MADGHAPQTTGSQWPRTDRRATVLLLLAIAGCVDGVGLAELGHLFVSAMSGNTTIAGLALAYRDWPVAAVPLGLVALFVGGVMIGALVGERTGTRAPFVLLLLQAALLGLACLAYHGPRPMLGSVLLPVAMGLANLVVTRLAGKYPGATYVSGTLVRVGIGLARGDARGVAADMSLWLAMLVGAFAGGWGRLGWGIDVLLAPVAALLLLAIAAFGRAR